MSTCLKIFSVDNNTYLLSIFTEEDNRTEVTDGNGNIVLTFTSDLFIQKNNINIGYFYQNEEYIYFTFDLNSSYLDIIKTNIVSTGIDSIFNAEVEITKFYLNKLKESAE